MNKTIRLRCIARHTSFGTVPDALSGGMVEKQFNVFEFKHPQPPTPPENATPRIMARYMAMQPTTAAKVEVTTVDPEMVFELGREYYLSITSDEELRDS